MSRIANRMWKKIMGIGIVEPIDDFQDGNVAILPELLEHLTDEMSFRRCLLA